MISLCFSITLPGSMLTANKRLCVHHRIRIILRCVSVSPSLFHPTPNLTTITLWLPFSSISSSLWCLPVVCILQASVGWRHSPQAAEHLPFFTQGGRGERLPPDRHQQSYHRQRGQSQGPRYSEHFRHKNQGRGGKSPRCQSFIVADRNANRIWNCIYCEVSLVSLSKSVFIHFPSLLIILLGLL